MEKTQNVKIILKSILFSYILTFLLILIYAFLLAYTQISESTIPVCLFVIGMISVFISSSSAIIKIKKDGLKNGAIIGFSYVGILYLLSSIYETGFSLNKYSILTIILYVILGMIGGIIGVNLVNNK